MQAPDQGVQMGSEDRDTRWRELASLRDEFERDDVVLPMITSRIDGRPRKPSPEAVDLAEALAVTTSWSGISGARTRRLAA